MLEIDAAMGEGGGQILRSALSLSLVTRRAIRLTRIRARRPRPGLQAQHLKAVEAAAAVSAARVEGAQPGSQTLEFTPGEVRGRALEIDIGTAGSTLLVLQTVFVPLALARHASTLTISGGTHNPWSPPFHYVAWQWLPWLERIGYRASLALERAGFSPAGGGRIRAEIHPAARLEPLRLVERGALARIRGVSGCARACSTSTVPRSAERRRINRRVNSGSSAAPPPLSSDGSPRLTNQAQRSLF